MSLSVCFASGNVRLGAVLAPGSGSQVGRKHKNHLRFTEAGKLSYNKGVLINPADTSAGKKVQDVFSSNLR